MPARRCGLCSIDYPPLAQFGSCPIHEEATTWVPDRDPDDLWEWKASLILRRLELGEDGHIPVARGVDVRAAEGQLWVKAHDLVRAGIRHTLSADDVIEIQSETEDGVVSALYEILGRRESSREHWVRRICFDWPENCREQ